MKIKFLKIIFSDLNSTFLKKKIINGGLFLLPSGPGLANFKINDNYHFALRKADYVMFDSGYFVLLLFFLKLIKVKKTSGYKFMQILFEIIENKKVKKIFLLEPSLKTSKKNYSYFKKKFNIDVDNYVCPVYDINNIFDKKLLNILKLKKPKFILINIGGGVQEILGHYLKEKLNYKATILCTGAALAFYTREQAPITNFFDYIYLGWLVRILFSPKIFIPRYFNAIKLIKLVFFNKVDVIAEPNKPKA